MKKSTLLKLAMLVLPFVLFVSCERQESDAEDAIEDAAEEVGEAIEEVGEAVEN